MFKKVFRKVLKITGYIVLTLVLALVALRVVSGIVTQRKFNAKLAELRQRGEPLSLAEMAPPEIPPNENAATLYGQAFAQIDLLPKETRDSIRNLATKREPLTPGELEEARKLLKEAKELLRLLREGSRRPRCRFPIDYSRYAFDVLMPHLTQVRAGSRLLSVSACVNLADGKPDAALDDCATALRLAHSVDDEPFLISMLVEVAVTEMALSRLQTVLNEAAPSKRALETVPPALGDTSDRSQFVRVMQGERCFGLSALHVLLNEPGKFRALTGDSSFPGRILCFLFKPILLSDGRHYLNDMDRLIEAAGKPWRDAAATWVEVSDAALLARRRYSRPVTSMILPALHKAGMAFDRGIARSGCGKLAVTLRLYRMKHNRYPEQLSALVPGFIDKLPADPFSGKDYVYRKEGKGFIVYSLGSNMTDDGGVEDPKAREAGDVVWKCSR